MKSSKNECLLLSVVKRKYMIIWWRLNESHGIFGRSHAKTFNWRKCYFVGVAIDAGSILDSEAVGLPIDSATDWFDWVQLWHVLRYEIGCACANGPFDRSLRNKFMIEFFLLMKISNELKLPFPHSWQTCRFSPLWMTKCRVSCSLRLNAFMHTVHTNGRSELWDCLCRVKWSLRFNAALQMSQMNLRSRLWPTKCSSSKPLSLIKVTWLNLFSILNKKTILLLKLWALTWINHMTFWATVQSAAIESSCYSDFARLRPNLLLLWRLLLLLFLGGRWCFRRRRIVAIQSIAIDAVRSVCIMCLIAIVCRRRLDQIIISGTWSIAMRLLWCILWCLRMGMMRLLWLGLHGWHMALLVLIQNRCIR